MNKTISRIPDAAEVDQDGLVFDSFNRLTYHPDFHPNHGKPFSLDDLIYICKFHGIDELRTLAFAVGKTEHTVASKITQLRSRGLYLKYKELSYEEWCQITEGR